MWAHCAGSVAPALTYFGEGKGNEKGVGPTSGRIKPRYLPTSRSHLHSLSERAPLVCQDFTLINLSLCKTVSLS